MRPVSEASGVESVPTGGCLLSRRAPLAPCQARRFAPGRDVDGGRSLHTLVSWQNGSACSRHRLRLCLTGWPLLLSPFLFPSFSHSKAMRFLMLANL